MSDTELQDLRAWAAGVCGYKLNEDRGGFWYDTPHGHVDVSEWQPDQNIAQAIEVLDALTGKHDAEWTLQFLPASASVKACYACGIVVPTELDIEIQHESRELAILLACRKALEGTKQ